MVRDASLTGSDIATGRQWSVQFVLCEALVREDKGRAPELSIMEAE